MRISHLDLKNFKCFEKLSAEFKLGVNLLVGVNGSGKTALLESITVALGGFGVGQLPQQHQRPISKEEVRISVSETVEQVRVEARSEVGTWVRSYNAKTESNDSKALIRIRAYADDIFSRLRDLQDRTVAPLIRYEATKRLFSEGNKTKQLEKELDYTERRRLGYLRFLDEESIRPIIIKWLTDTIVNRTTYQINNVPLDNQNSLEVIEQALIELMKVFMDLRDETTVRLFPDLRYKDDLVLSFDGNPPIPLNYYSDGFRALIFLVMDLVWRATMLNPWLNLSELSNQQHGVVLIDEIDLHLHPKWQAKAISFLQKLFPNVQFFITTHSAVVVSNFKPRTSQSQGAMDALYTLGKSGRLVTVNDRFYGKEVNDVLTQILGANDRNEAVQALINQLFDTIDRNELDDAQMLLDELIKIVGTDDSAVYRAQTMMNWKKFEKEEQKQQEQTTI